jgi:hypothetical protein
MASPAYKNFMKIHLPVQKLLAEDTQTDWWFDNPNFISGNQNKN